MRKNRWSLSLALAAVAGLLTAAPATATPAEAASSVPPPRSDNELAVEVRSDAIEMPIMAARERAEQRHAPDASTLDLLRGGPRSPQPEIQEAQRSVLGDFLERATGQPSMGLAGEAAASAPDVAESTEAIIDRGFVDDPDLTGDGLADALTYEARYRDDDGWWRVEDVTLVALRGSDGDDLWRRVLSISDDAETYVVTLPDLDGDAAADLGLLTVTYASWYQAESWKFEVISGASGEPRWSREIDARATSQLVGSRTTTTVPAIAVLPIPISDQNGDGLADLLLETISMTYTMDRTSVGPVRRYGDEQSSATRAEFLVGATGAPIATLTKTSPAQISVLESSGQSVGGPADDFAWIPAVALGPSRDEMCIGSVGCEPTPTLIPEEDEFSVEMIDGETRLATWSLTMPKTLYDWPIDVTGRDLDADGANDLLWVARWVEESEYYVWPKGLETLTLLHGNTGATGWQQHFEEDAWAWYSTRIGPIGGEAGSDLLLFTDEIIDEDHVFAIHRVDGATASGLAVTYANSAWGVWLMDDANLDSIPDLMVETYREVQADEYVQDVRVESGSDGVPLFTETMDGWFDNLYPAGDLDGDGAGDLLRITETDHRRSQDIRLAAVNVLDGSESWSLVRVFDHRESAVLRDIDDATGDGGGDLFLDRSMTEWDGSEVAVFRSSVEVDDGASGAVAWSHGDVMPIPSSPGTGSITGRVLDEAGIPIEDICVRPHPASGWTTYASRTTADGVYVIDELDPDGYTLRFSDCDEGRYAGEWFEDAATAAQSTAVLVAEGETVTLPDAEIAFLPPPINDAIADAIPVTTLPFTDQRSIADATSEDSEPDDCWNDKSIWYLLEPSEAIDVRATLHDGRQDLAMSWFEIVDGDLVNLSCGYYDPDDGSIYTEQALEAEGSYLLRVAGDEWTSTGVDLTIEEISMPRISGRIVDANGEPISTACVVIAEESGWSPDIWIIIDTVQTDSDGRYRSQPLYGGPFRIGFDDCGRGTYVSEWFDDVGTFPEATDVVVDGIARTDIDAQLDGPLPGATNDDLRDALRVELPALDRRLTVTATQQLFETALCGPTYGTVWYRFTAPVSGTVAIDTRGSNFDTFLGAYLQQPTPVTTLGCNDDTFLQAAYLEIPVTAGRGYLVQAGGYRAERGALKISMSLQSTGTRIR